jgi:hypothetical protein
VDSSGSDPDYPKQILELIMETCDFVVLACGYCGAEIRMQREEFEAYRKERFKTGRVLLCDKPSTIPGSKQRCGGVMVEKE